jgi:ferredoxin
MKIEVNSALCSGHARCNAAAPEIYELNDDGFCAITTLEVAPDQEAAAVKGAAACPERAITIVAS